MTTIGLVRHGVTDWNNERRMQGQTDIPLNEEGKRQAARLAQRLVNEQWDLIYSSDLSRAYETAVTIGYARQLNVFTDQRLREIHLGQLEGTTEAERIERWGADWSRLDLGVETNDSIGSRGEQCLSDIEEKHHGKRVLVVSHGALMGVTLKRLVPHAVMETYLQNTSLTIVRKKHEAEGWDCDLYNCVKHLAEE